MIIQVRCDVSTRITRSDDGAEAGAEHPHDADGKQFSLPEWIILEMQGKIQAAGDISDLSGTIMGEITMKSDGKAVLEIGHHRVTGEVKSLPKPMILIQKDDGSIVDDVDMAALEPQARPDETSYTIRGVIRRKFLFGDRPQPIVNAGFKRK